MNATTSLMIQTFMYVLNQSIVQEENSYNYYYWSIGQEPNASKCIGSYGCFELTPPWTSPSRPVSHYPEDLQKIEPRYPFYTRQNPTDPSYFDLNEYDVIESSGVDPNLPTYVITHGYMEAGDRPWIRDMTRELLIREDCNVIVIDWHKGSGPPYTQAVANIRLVGAMTAHLLADLSRKTHAHNLKHVHCIGHSLGAHLSGYIGYTLQKDFNLTLGRITGLDPAEPHFANTDAPVRLDKSAADYVDIVHTDASGFMSGGLGITESIGHIDYFPNGGSNQPGCDKSVIQYINIESGSFFRGIRKYLSCNHVRSHEFFIESINPRCSFMTISCKSFADFQAGNCFECGKNHNHCIPFGYHSRSHYEKLMQKKMVHPTKSLVQYFLTGEQKPFCRGHYKITVAISESEESKSHGGEIGQLWFVMHSTTDGRGQKSRRAALNSGGYHEPGAIYKAVIAADEVPHLKAVEVEWQYHSSVFNPLTWRLTSSPRVYLAKVTVEALEIRERITVCPRDEKALVNGQPQVMLPSFC